MRGIIRALVSAVAVLAPLAAQPGYAGVADDFWLETHAGADHFLIGERWDAESDPAAYPADSIYDPLTGAIAEFGGGHAYSSSSLSGEVPFTYSYADAAWFDRVTVFNQSMSYGEEMPVYLHFGLSGVLDIVEVGTRPDGASTEGRAAVTANVKSGGLDFWAHGYDMWARYDGATGIMRTSGNWDLGGAADAGGWRYSYDDVLVLPLMVRNGVEFDLWAKISVGTSASITLAGAGGLGDFDMTSTSDFLHSMTLGGFTDENGDDIRDTGFQIWSEGPTFGGPQVPEPASVLLGLAGIVTIACAGKALRV